MNDTDKQYTASYLAAALAQAPVLAEMFRRLHPEQALVVLDYLNAVNRMRAHCERPDDPKVDEQGELFSEAQP